LAKVKKVAENFALDRAASGFLLARRASGASSKTIGLYSSVLNRTLIPAAAADGVHTVGELNQAYLDKLGAALLEPQRGLSRATVHSYLRAINSFLGWARLDEIPGADSTGRARKPRLEQRLLDVLTAREMTRLEEQAARKPAGGDRDSLIIAILSSTGFRAGELCGLRIQDLQEEARGDFFLRVMGKGNKERRVPIGRDLARRMQRYVSKVRPKRTSSDRIFLTLIRHPRTNEYEPITPSGVLQMVKCVAADAGISKRVYSHLLRHSFATNYLRQGGDPVSLRRILGHSSLEMIDRTYTHLVDSDLAESMREYHRRLSAQLRDAQ
jgi:site-specific recombinase XerD